MSLHNSKVLSGTLRVVFQPRPPPSPSDPWLSQQTPEETRQIRDPAKSKTLPVFQTPTRQRRKRRAA